MKSSNSSLWRVLRRGGIAYIGAKIILMPAFLVWGVSELQHRRALTSPAWDLVSFFLLIALPFWAAFFSRHLLRSPGTEKYRRELIGETHDYSPAA